MATEANLHSLQSKQNLIVPVFHSYGGAAVRHTLTHPPSIKDSQNLSPMFCPGLCVPPALSAVSGAGN